MGREMAAILGCNEETVRERLIELDLPRLPGKARPEKNAFWRGGYTVGHRRCTGATAAAYDSSAHLLEDDLEQHGVNC